ncbi:DNA mismatch repair protein MutL [Didymella exigua CBS 183.55]|uniref:DNA mismatch repair protein PMS1 n=1 Tax=Didymella exigua CBS 183.55 TaxID=1150837 RepID=A0A6A5RC97_9PLEO|nr:DNA mismatch repair protein MutL [Didymella exigua CBS 183.55]KAF1924910.1 DNA mismatch repair protein MutL [Didymella exigua CBS 183.55]
MATIKPIEGRSVHQIQSGQVIVDLQSVCKELVENSIDAGATSVEVRFKNNGLDAIEVQDNGGGIAPADYDTIALKHYTSKLSTYDDLSSLKTFGFRGEALSSLCALSKFHIVTARASDGPKGTRLDFEQSGKLKGTSVVAAKQGTTVVVETLFYNLPVRRKELEKNVKREYNKVLALLNAYACISVGVKFSVTNLIPKGKKIIAFATNGNPSTRGNISNVYGAKTIAALIPLDLDFEMNPSHQPGATQSAKNRSTQDDSDSRKVRIVGHISRPVVGEGRQTPDRQMFFVNSRPCNLPQVAKAFNEVYKSYNVTQSPFIFADIQLDTEAYDVNASPDKRTIMLHDQTVLLESIKESLAELFAGHDQSVPQGQLLGKQQTTFKPPLMQSRGSTLSIAGDDSGIADGAVGAPSDARKRFGVPIPETPGDALPGFVKASLIESFAERDAQDRVAKRLPRLRRSSSQENNNVIEERIFHPSVRRQSAMEEPDGATNVPQSRSQSPLFEPEQPTSPSRMNIEPPSKAVQDFNARIASIHARQVERQRSPRSPGPTSADADGDEEPISAIKQTPHKALSQNSIQNAFDRMRPMRTPLQQATITIGGTTTTTAIGIGSQSRSAKRARIHTPKSSLNGTPLSQDLKISLFTKGLRGFAAPGTQAEVSEEEDDDEQNSSMPTTDRTPSRNAKATSRAFEEPLADELLGSSSAPPPREPVANPPDRDSLMPDAEEVDASDKEYVDEETKKAREDARIARLIAEAEEAAARPTDINVKRASKLFKVSHSKHSIIYLDRVVETKVELIARHLHNIQTSLDEADAKFDAGAMLPTSMQFNKEDPEERLSLTVTKRDFNEMQIIGQFNLGFIIAVRPPTLTSPTSDLFIIDQHASDEKYNFERLSATTVLVSQRLVHPHPLELTAVEEEIILANEHSLTANGFVVELDTSYEERRAKLTSLPMSKEVTFTPTDLEELLALVMDNPPSSSTSTSPYIPRPSKVRKLLASRACRSSVMIGKTLQNAQMENIVRHMGSMDKPWSCPHGRPTMRHLYGLEKWQGWNEGDGVAGADLRGEKADWARFLKKHRVR